MALKISGSVGSESRTLAMLEHDHIVQVFSEAVDWQQGVHLLCMQLVPGTTLGKVIQDWRRSGSKDGDRTGAALLAAVESLSPPSLPIVQPSLRDRDQLMRSDPVDAVAWLGARLAEALDHAHRAGIVHRDIKPANILVRDRDVAMKIVDFGVARLSSSELTGAGDVFGSPAYMAPEQFRGDAADGRSDLFSLSVILYQALSGERPFAGEELSSLAYTVVHSEPPPVSRRLTRCRNWHPGTISFSLRKNA